MRRVPKVLLWVAGLAAATAAALTVIALTVDPDAYRPLVQTEVSRALGREVSIQQLSFGWSLRPTLVVKDLRIANPAWASRPYLLTARKAAVRVDLLALWHGRVEIRNLALEGANLLLETDRDGKRNWTGDTVAPGATRQQKLQLPDFDAIALTDSEIGWHDANGVVTDGYVDHASATLAADRPLTLALRGRFRDTPLVVDLEANTSLQDALRGTPITASMALQAHETRAAIEIVVPKPFDLAGITLKLDAEGKRLDTLSALLQEPLPAWGPYRIAARAAFTAGSVRLTDLRGAIEGLPTRPERVEIRSGEAQLSRTAPTVVRATGTLDASAFALDLTTASLPALAAASAPIPLAGRLVVGPLEVGAKGEIDPWTGLRSADVAVTAQGDAGALARLLGAAPFRKALPVALSARIVAGPQEIGAQALRGTIAGCTVAGNLAVQRAPRPKLVGALDLGRLDLAAFERSAATSATAPANAAPEGEPPRLAGMEADVRLQIKRVVGLPLQVEQLSAQTTLADQRLTLRGLRGSLAGTALAGNAELSWKGARPHLDATIRVPTLNLATLTPGKRGDGSALGPDTLLPLAPLRSLDADLQLDVGRIDGASIPIDSLRASARLARARLTVSPLQVRLAGIAAQSTFTLDAASDDARLNARATAASVDLAHLLLALDAKTAVSGTLGPAELTVQTHGATARTLLAQAQADLQLGASTLRLDKAGEEARVEQASATAAPGAPVQVRARGTVQATPFELAVTGGPLSELLSIERAWPEITAELRTTVRKQSVRLAVSTGPFEHLITGRAVPVAVEATTDGARATVSGVIADLHDPSRSPLHAEINVASLSRVPFVLTDSPMPDVPLALSATVRVAANAVSAEALIVRSGETRLIGAAGIARKGRLELNASLQGDVLDLRPWSAQRASGEAGVSLLNLLGPSTALDRPIPVETLRAIGASLRLRVARLLAPGLELNDYRMDVRLDDGLLDVTNAIAEGNMRIQTRLDVRQEIPAAAVRVSAQDLDLEALKLARTEALGTNLPQVSLYAELAGLGTTPRQMYASANGTILFTAGPGQVRAVASPLVLQDVFVQLITVLTPGRKPDNYADLQCAAARFDIAKGVATSPDGIALRFKDMDILGSGAINLSTGEILFGFKAVRRSWLSFSPIDLASDFARISGTLAKPKVGLDPENVLVKGTAAWATLGISLLATDLLRKMQATKDPCAQIAANGHTAGNPLDALIQALPLPGRKPAAPPAAASRPAQ